MTEARREQLFTGLAVALLLFTSMLDARLTVAAAAALLVLGGIFLRNRVRGFLAAAIAGGVALATVAAMRVLTQ